MPATRAAVPAKGWRAIPLVAALSAAVFLSCDAGAAMLGHSRIVSAPGQPLRIDVPVIRLSADELRTLRVSLAAPADWARAGLNPPVELSSLRVGVDDGPQPGTRIVHISSSAAFDRPVADLLLEVQSASGRQQYQVSVLAPPRSVAASSAAGAAADGAAVGAARRGGAAHAAVRIRVRQGDYLFALARRHAVPGVSVYQMMVGLLRANPQAFIHDNMNLVKAGAVLRVPGASVLTSISDREARRIFEEQALAFARYRQGLAGQRMADVRGAPADRGKVAAAQDNASQERPALQPRDRLELSSGGSAVADARADRRVAARKGIADSRQRISELEDNVGQLDRALHAQSGTGQAAAGRDTGVGGLGAPAAGTAVGGALLASASSTPAGALPGAENSGSRSFQASQGGTGGMTIHVPGAAGNASGQGNAMSRAGTKASGGGMVPGGSAASNASPVRGSQAGHALQGSTSGAAGQQAAAGHAGAAGHDAGAGQAGAGASSAESAIPAAEGAPGHSGQQASGGQAGAQAGAADAAHGADSSTDQTSNKAGQSVSWIQEHMLGVITGLLALVVLIIAWLLRRANIARDDDGDDQPSAITEAMVKEKLDKINLDLNQPPTDELPAAKG